MTKEQAMDRARDILGRTCGIVAGAQGAGSRMGQPTDEEAERIAALILAGHEVE